MRPLRIVLVCLEAPLPFGHVTGRWSSALLKELTRRGHQVTAYAACTRSDEAARAKQLFPSPAYDLRTFEFPVLSRPQSLMRTAMRPQSHMFSTALSNDLRSRLAQPYDILHLEQLPCAWLAPVGDERTLTNVHYLHHVETRASAPGAYRARIRHGILRAAERRLLRRGGRVAAVTDRLTEEIRQLVPSCKVETLGFGLDLSLYDFIVRRAPAVPIVSVIGNMRWQPSFSAAERFITKLWPRIKAAMPTAGAQIVGWGAKATLGAHASVPGLTLHEDVDDIKPYFGATGVLLYAPSEGSGIKVKVLEAFALGVPVVTTSAGVEGLPAMDGVHAGVSNDDAGLIDRTLKLLSEAALQDRYRIAARALLEAECSSKAVVDRAERIYCGLLAAAEDTAQVGKR